MNFWTFCCFQEFVKGKSSILCYCLLQKLRKYILSAFNYWFPRKRIKVTNPLIIESIGTGQLILRRLFPGTGRPSLILMIHQGKRCAEIGSSPSFFQNSKIFYSRRGEKTGGTRLPGAIFRNLTGEQSRGKRGDKQGGKWNSLLGRSISYGYQTRLGMAHCPPLGNRWMAATVDGAGSEKWRIKL